MVVIDGLRLEKIAIEKLIPHPMNPRVDLVEGMPEYEKLRDSIEHHTYIDPIIWNKRSGHIIAGHQRLQVIKDLAEKDGTDISKIPVIVVDLPENEEMTFLVSDNKITGFWDPQKLKAIFEKMDATDYRYTGYDDFEITSMISDDEEQLINEFFQEAVDDEEIKTKKRTVVCPHCGETFEL